MRGNGEMNLAKIAGLCEQKFGEWGHRTAIVKRFRDLLWEASGYAGSYDARST